MQFEAKLTLDGLMTLAAGVIAFIAVIIQIRFLSNQVRQQINAQRDAEHEESEKQKRAIAAALLAEIDDFYKFSLRGLWGNRNRLRGAIEDSKMPPPELGPLPSTALVVYRATADQLGALSVTTVKSAVSLYNFIANFIDTYEAYRVAWSPSIPAGSKEMATKLRDVFDPLPTLILKCYQTCEQLAKEQAIPFEKSGFSVAEIGERNEKGQTMKQALEDEAARIRQRLET